MGMTYYLTSSTQQEEQKQINLLIMNTFRKQIQQIIKQSQWGNKLFEILKSLTKKQLFQYSYQEDIVIFRRQNDSFYKSQKLINFQQIQQKIRSSCVIPQDEQIKLLNSNHEKNLNQSGMTDESFISKVEKNESIAIQIDIIYKSQFNEQCRFNLSMKRFLKWIQMAENHLQRGFLRSIYRNFGKILTKQINNNIKKQLVFILDNVNEQTIKFIDIMTNIYLKVYKLDVIRMQQNGELFNYDNMHNFVLNNFFKINHNFISQLRVFMKSKLKPKIQHFQNKVSKLKQQDIQFFQIPKEFQLLKPQIPNHKTYQNSINILQQIYQQKTPISKLKILIKTAKQILCEIKQYYNQINKEAPNLDPDSLNSIAMYIIVNSKNSQELIIQLEIIERFSTSNNLNCISGYYLNVFKATIQYILQN